MAAVLHSDLSRATDSNGDPLSGALLYFYATGTTTPQAVYTTAALSVAHAHPVVADSGGRFPPIYLDGSLIYRGVLKTAAGVTSQNGDIDPLNADALAALSEDNGAASVFFKQAGSGTVNRSAGARFAEQFAVTDFTGVATAGADETADIITGIAANSRPFLIAPYGTKFDRAALLASASVPVGRVILDLSGVNDWQQTGSTVAKSFGLLSKDNGPNDTHWYVGSDHHSILNLNNYGTAGTTSASERKASILWSAGEFSGANEGFRGAAILQFTKESSSTRWIFNLRSLAPWNAIANNYEYWVTGAAIPGAGTYRIYNDQIYVSTGGGTTGATPPTHLTGTVSDGGISWTHFDSGDRSIFMVTEEGRVLIGPGSLDNTFRHAVSPFDTQNSYIGEWAAKGVNGNVLLKMKPTNGSSVETAVPAFLAKAANGLEVVKSDYATPIVSFTDGDGFKVFHTTLQNTAASGASIAVAGRRKLTVTNGAATNLDTLTGGVNDQELLLYFADGNTTVRNMIGNIHLTGSVNQAFTQHSTLELHRVNGTDRWVEVSRSIK